MLLMVVMDLEDTSTEGERSELTGVDHAFTDDGDGGRRSIKPKGGDDTMGEGTTGSECREMCVS